MLYLHQIYKSIVTIKITPPSYADTHFSDVGNIKLENECDCIRILIGDRQSILKLSSCYLLKINFFIYLSPYYRCNFFFFLVIALALIVTQEIYKAKINSF